MRRGSTPAHLFHVNIDASEAEEIYITYAQGDKILIEKSIDDIQIDPGRLLTLLSQEETLRFIPGVKVQIQIRVKLPGGVALVSNIMQTDVQRVIKQGVI